jgi:hypothetical protein
MEQSVEHQLTQFYYEDLAGKTPAMSGILKENYICSPTEIRDT